MKIGLAHITLESRLRRSQKEDIHVAPLGLGYIAAFLEKRGWHSDLHSIKTCDEDDAILSEKSSLAGYDILGFTVHTQNLRRTISLINYLKMRRPGMVIVLGGAHATVCHREIIRDFPAVDIVVKGDGERVFFELIECISRGESLDNIMGITFRRSGEIIDTRAQPDSAPLDEIPYPRRDFEGFPELLIDRYDYRDRRVARATVLNTSRGCPYQCSFCAIQENSGRRWRAHSPRYVLDEASMLRESMGAEHFFLVDANFLVDPARALEIARGLSRMGCTFSCATRVDQLLEARDVVRSFRNLGCAMIELGIESGSQSVLDKYNKGTTVAQNEEAIRLLRELDIRLGFDFIMFMPKLTFNELCESFSFLKRNGLSGIEPFETLMKRVNLYPGTALRREWEAGIPASPHSLPDYVFEDERVNMVYRQALGFINRYSIEVKQKIIAIRKASFFIEGALARRSADVPPPIKREIQDIVLECDMMNRIPYLFFEKLLGAAGTSKTPVNPGKLLDSRWNKRVESFCREAEGRIERLREIESRLGVSVNG